MNDNLFVGVLVTSKSKRMHLLVNLRTHRTACRKNIKLGQLFEGTDYWDGSAPVQCSKCAEEWKKRQAEVV